MAEEDDKITEVDHIKEAFKANEYKPWLFNFSQPERTTETTQQEPAEDNVSLGCQHQQTTRTVGKDSQVV